VAYGLEREDDSSSAAFVLQMWKDDGTSLNYNKSLASLRFVLSLDAIKFHDAATTLNSQHLFLSGFYETNKGFTHI
jgi:hypothetical protein